MKVGLDATPLSIENGGLRRYTEELASALRASFPEDEYALLGGGGKWWSCGLPYSLARGRFSIFHGTNFEVPYLPVCPSVMTIHDLSPWLDQGWHTGADRVRGRTPMLLRLGLAKRIITPTEAVRRQALERFSLHPDRVVAIPEAAASWLRPGPGPVDRPYFLYVGTLEPRKNIPTVVEAWRQVRDLGVDLVLAGRQRSDFAPIAPEPGLRLLGSVPDSDLAPLYSNAIATLYPSLYEGFGLPVLEAMQCGSPVITSRDAAVCEVSAGAALHIHALDVSGWAEAMRAVATNRDLRAERKDVSLRRAAEFNWSKTARLTHEVYREAVGD